LIRQTFGDISRLHMNWDFRLLQRLLEIECVFRNYAIRSRRGIPVSPLFIFFWLLDLQVVWGTRFNKQTYVFIFSPISDSSNILKIGIHSWLQINSHFLALISEKGEAYSKRTARTNGVKDGGEIVLLCANSKLQTLQWRPR